MADNPNPSLITDPMWRLWEDRPNPAWLLSGIYANKKGYHNTVIANKLHWPDNYSIKLPLDLKGPQDKARAIDLTMTDSEMVIWTKRMRDSALNPDDDRLSAVKEFYGTVNNTTVFGLAKDSETGDWRSSSADSTHLWHGHTSIFSFFVNQWPRLRPLLSVWAGQSFTEWRGTNMLVDKGDSGNEVKFWQAIHNELKSLYPDIPILDVDGDYGDTTAKAFAWFAHKKGANATYTGQSVTYWVAMKYHQDLAVVSMPKVTLPVSLDESKLKTLVNEWLTTNLPHNVTVNGTLTGKVTI